jgi:hypothetical protein
MYYIQKEYRKVSAQVACQRIRAPTCPGLAWNPLGCLYASPGEGFGVCSVLVRGRGQQQVSEFQLGSVGDQKGEGSPGFPSHCAISEV